MACPDVWARLLVLYLVAYLNQVKNLLTLSGLKHAVAAGELPLGNSPFSISGRLGGAKMAWVATIPFFLPH